MAARGVKFEDPSEKEKKDEKSHSRDKKSDSRDKDKGKTKVASPRPDYFFEDSVKRSISKDYDIEEKLGLGAFGVVKKAKSKKTGLHVAIKCCKKAAVNPKEIQAEVRVMRMVQDHPGIVKMEGVYESKNRVNIVMELITGGELFDKIVELEHYSESDAAALIKQIAVSVEYCHKKNIVHRDLKPENLLFQDEESKILKLIDFGVAEVIEDTEQLVGLVGSRTYMAPEVLGNKPYGKPADLFSIGVIMYILLSGYPPFDPEQGITELEFPSPDWDEVSQTAKDIISNLLDNDPSKRMTATELKTHTWTTGVNVSKTKLNRTIKSMSAFNTYRKVATAALPSRQKRVSVFGMFGLNKEKQKIQSAANRPATTDAEAALRESLETHHTYFQKIAKDMMDFSGRQTDAARRQKLIKSSEEMKLLANAYKELADEYVSLLGK